MTEVASIIIADDEPLLVQLYCDAISNQGLHITKTFKNGRELINYLKSTNGRKVIILDHLMPLHSGISVVKEIKKDANGKDHYFILVTGDTSSLAEAREAGADEILVKPFRMKSLTEAINKGMTILSQ